MRWGLALAVGVAVSGCTVSGASDDPTVVVPTTVVVTETADGPRSGGTLSEPDTGATESATGSTRSPDASGASAEKSPDGLSGGGQLSDIEQRHPNGSVLRITGVEVEDTAVTIGIEVVNGSGSAIQLAFNDQVALIDDLGGTYEFILPAQNQDLNVPERGTLTGDLVFFGIVDPDATKVRMQTNTSSDRLLNEGPIDTNSESENTRFPNFSVEIPIAR